MPQTSLRFLVAVAGTAILVPCAGNAIQTTIIGVGNGHGLSSAMYAVATGVAVLPLAIVAAPINAVGATVLGAFSLGLERLIRRRSVLIWLIHGFAVGCLNLMAFGAHNRSDLVIQGVMGSWIVGALAMWSILSAPRLADEGVPTI